MIESCGISTYTFRGKSYEPMGRIKWKDLKQGDFYANRNGLVGKVITSSGSIGQCGKYWKRVQYSSRNSWVSRTKDFEVTLLVEVNTNKQRRD
jgi:hypothetical protein